MGLPTSLYGTLGFIIFVVFIVAITVPSINSKDADTIATLQNNALIHNNSVNSSVGQCGFTCFIGQVTGLGGIYDWIIGFFQMIADFITLALAYVGIFTNVFLTVPPVFYVIFLLVSLSAIVAIVKLIFLSGD